MAVRSINAGNIGELTLTFRLNSSKTTVDIGEVVAVDTSGPWTVGSHTDANQLRTTPIGVVTTKNKDSTVLSVRMLNVTGVHEAVFSTAPTLGLSVMTAVSALDTFVGSTADDKNWVVAVNTPVSGTSQWLSF